MSVLVGATTLTTSAKNAKKQCLLPTNLINLDFGVGGVVARFKDRMVNGMHGLVTTPWVYSPRKPVAQRMQRWSDGRALLRLKFTNGLDFTQQWL